VLEHGSGFRSLSGWTYHCFLPIGIIAYANLKCNILCRDFKIFSHALYQLNTGLAALHGSITTKTIKIDTTISANGVVTSSVTLTKDIPGSICYGMTQHKNGSSNLIITKLQVKYTNATTTTVYYSFKNISSSQISTTVEIELIFFKPFYLE
jgi:hypothetical protein